MRKKITERDRELIIIIDKLINWIHDNVELEDNEETNIFHKIIGDALVTIYGEVDFKSMDDGCSPPEFNILEV